MFDRSVLVGVVFDLSLSHASDGQRNIDVIKDALIKKIIDSNLLTKIYVSHDEWVKVPRDQGESTFFVISYQEPKSFSLDIAFKRAINVVGECKEDCDKYVFLITDRFQPNLNFQYKKGFLNNNIRGFDTKICIFSLGATPDFALSSLVDEYDGSFHHLNSACEMYDVILKILNKENS